MKLIFQIAAGVIIAILATNIYFMRTHQSNMGQSFHAVGDQTQLIKGANTSATMIRRYLKTHNKLPRYASDLNCSGRGFSCPQVGEDGAFYMISGDQWLRLELELKGGELAGVCSVTDKLLVPVVSNFWSNCTHAKNKAEPSIRAVRVPCESAHRKYQKMICQSDRLAAADWAAEDAFQAALERSKESRKVRIISDQKQRLKADLVACEGNACIESTLWSRYAELQRY